MDTAGEGAVRVNEESSVDIYTIRCVEQIAGGNLLDITGSSAGRSVMTAWVGWNRWEGDSYTHIYFVV